MPEGEAPDLSFLDERERAAIRDALAHVDGANRAQAAVVRGNLARLGRLAALIRDAPAVAPPSPSHRFHRDPGEALIDVLCRVPEYLFDLHMPTKAVLGQAYLVAKINTFKSVAYALEATSDDARLRERIDAEVGQSIYSKMAEELFVSIVTEPDGARAVKVAAAQHLFRIWEDRLDTEVDDFAPLLESAWDARNRVRPVLGTMLGAHEVFRLVRELRDERFLDYFGGDEASDDEVAAFEEFLFGLSFEDIARLRAHLAESGHTAVSPGEARAILGADGAAFALEVRGPQAIYTSYRQRRFKATYRALTAAAGPKKTAEEYVMAVHLRRGAKT